MQHNRITMTMDAAFPSMGIAAGQTVSFLDGLPTVDDGLAFYISQLAHLEGRIYETKYTSINYQEMIPIESSVPEWADSWDYISYDAVTMGKFIGSSADDLPNVTASANKSTVPIGYAGNSFDYSLDELRKSQQQRMPISDLKSRAAFRGSQEHSQRVAYYGDASRNMTGLFNNPNVSTDNSAVDYNTATGPEIFEDANQILIDIWMDSANTHVPNAVAFDSKRYAKMVSTPMSETFPQMTIMEYFLKNNLYTTMTGREITVFARLQLTAAERVKAGESDNDMMMAYELSDENLSMCNPIPWRALAPQLKGLNIYVPAEYKISGVEFRYPFSAKYRTFDTPMA